MKVFLILLFFIVLTTEACSRSPCPCQSNRQCRGHNFCHKGHCIPKKDHPKGRSFRGNYQYFCSIDSDCPPQYNGCFREN
uniref:Nodule Cysteine-Rich (NCR) secreted peptide n=1 Tax=Caenorhabditis tropicalis TaxID=1561998 RepID=A0A1I7UFJ4_9PELO